MAFDGPNTLLFPGTPTDNSAGPTGLVSSLAGGIDIRCRFVVPAGSAVQSIAGISDPANLANSAFALNWSPAQPALMCYIRDASGGSINPQVMNYGTLGLPAAPGTWLTVRATYQVSTNQVVGYSSDDNGATWTQRQTFTPGTARVPNQTSTAAFAVAIGLPQVADPFSDRVAWVDLRAFDGTPLASADFTRQWPPSNTWTDPQGNTWSLYGSGWSWNGPPPPPLTIATTSLPAATRGVPYTAQLQAAGGFPPYTWAVTDGALPAGLSLAADGTISGTPT